MGLDPMIWEQTPGSRAMVRAEDDALVRADKRCDMVMAAAETGAMVRAQIRGVTRLQQRPRVQYDGESRDERSDMITVDAHATCSGPNHTVRHRSL